MATLLLRLRAPFQSWGLESYFDDRGTCTEPTKSGVIGVLAAALGRGRSSDISDLANLVMAVRVDREGIVENDFQIVQNVISANGLFTDKTVVSNKKYLADACFLVGLSGDKTLLKIIRESLDNPVWPLYAGRKSFPFSDFLNFDENLVEADLLDAVSACPYLLQVDGVRPEKLRVMIESPDGSIVRKDQPTNFYTREYSHRKLKMIYVPFPDNILSQNIFPLSEGKE